MQHMTCPKCGGHYVNVTAQATEKAKPRHGVLYWVLIGWWLHPLMWLFLTLPMIVWRLIRPNRKTETHTTTYAVCQSCGHTYEIH